MLTNKMLFHGLMVQIVAGYLGSLLGGIVALIEGRLISTQLLYWVMNIVGGAYVIYMLQKNKMNKSAKLLPIFIVLLTILGLLGVIFLWQQPIRYMSASFLLAIIVSVIVTGVGVTLSLMSLFLERVAMSDKEKSCKQRRLLFR